MADTKNTAAAAAKKNVKDQLTQQLESNLVALKEVLGEKKFKRRVKKVVKILGKGLNKKVAVPPVSSGNKGKTPNKEIALS